MNIMSIQRTKQGEVRVTAPIPVTLLFSDGMSQRLQVPFGGKLLEAASAAGLSLLTDCSNGQCGTCTAQLLSGRVELDDETLV